MHNLFIIIVIVYYIKSLISVSSFFISVIGLNNNYYIEFIIFYTVYIIDYKGKLIYNNLSKKLSDGKMFNLINKLNKILISANSSN